MKTHFTEQGRQTANKHRKDAQDTKPWGDLVKTRTAAWSPPSHPCMVSPPTTRFWIAVAHPLESRNEEVLCDHHHVGREKTRGTKEASPSPASGPAMPFHPFTLLPCGQGWVLAAFPSWLAASQHASSFSMTVY